MGEFRPVTFSVQLFVLARLGRGGGGGGGCGGEGGAVWGEESAGGGFGVEGDWGGGEVGDVVGEEEVLVVGFGVLLGEEEGFGGVAVVVDVCEVESGEEAVGASAGVYDPVGVGAPVVEAFGFGAVEGGEGVWGVGVVGGGGEGGVCGCGVEWEEPEVGFGVPDGEGAVVGCGEEDELSGGGYAREGYAEVLWGEVDDGVDGCGELSCGGVEGGSAEGVVDVGDVFWDGGGAGGAVVEGVAGGVEVGECFPAGVGFVEVW